MYLASRIVGIPGLNVECVLRHEGIEIWAKPLHSPSCRHHGSAKLRIKITRKRTVKRTRQSNRVMTLHLTSPKYHCQACGVISRIALPG